MAGLPKITASTLNAYTTTFTLRTITYGNDTYTDNTGAIQTRITTDKIIRGTALDLNPEQLQLKPLEKQTQYWKSFTIQNSFVGGSLNFRNAEYYIIYNGKTFQIQNELINGDSNFNIYHCCQVEND